MTITTDDGWIGATAQQVTIAKTASVTVVATTPFTLLDVDGFPGRGSLTLGNTANGLVPTDADQGFPAIRAFGVGNVGYLTAADLRSSVIAGWTLYDRLFHAGSYSLTSLGTTTLTSQPSFAGRIPGGDYSGLELFLEVNAAVSATATTVTLTYVNQSGTAGRTTASSGSLSGFGSRRLIPMTLQAGDSGIQQLSSVIVGGTVATTGSVNVVIGRRLSGFQTRLSTGVSRDLRGPAELGTPIVYDTSALWPVVISDGTASGGPSLMMTIKDG